jgi:hypothetical protein
VVISAHFCPLWIWPCPLLFDQNPLFWVLFSKIPILGGEKSKLKSFAGQKKWANGQILETKVGRKWAKKGPKQSLKASFLGKKGPKMAKQSL